VAVGVQGRGPVARPRSLDRVDREIIEQLQRDGRAPFRRIAGRIGVAEATVRSRYARLVEDRILQVTAVTNPLGLGFDAIGMLGLRTSGAPESVAEEISGWPEASYVVVTAGRFDVLVELVCADRPHLLEVMGRARSIDGVVSTEVLLYLQLAKQVYEWGTRAAEGGAA